MNVDLDGPVHYVDFGGPRDAPRVVYVHGLGGSHINWNALAPLLQRHFRAVAVDLPGFGLTPAAGRKTSVAANARVLRRFLRIIVKEPAMLIGNSMGGFVSMTVAAGEPELVDRLVLIDPTLPLARGVRVDPAVRKQFFLHGLPWVGERVLARRYATVPAKQRVTEVLARCCLDPARVPADMFEALVELETSLTEQRDHAAVHLAAARSIVYGLAWPKSYWRLMRAIDKPVLLLHGKHDRLISVDSAREAARRLPEWTYVELEAGHIPMMEVPELVAEQIVSWARLPRVP
ncbi:alpha/beta fold hydrolase [Allorhizocola rhizosphaerae]|uniref:alpha/beta fold hydrolase n=1 Tax=Allorhizocola rhizosphaerae TaxID=1872709 RepID=UPI000E3C57F8|nr:alpha/beta fold hydrolase [Allorhizocola rhizosphaerae]